MSESHLLYLSFIIFLKYVHINRMYMLLLSIVKVPNIMVPKIALSALFNIPTLVAYADGASFFYVVNDDLMLTSIDWTRAFVDKIMANPIYPGLGVAGGADVSDSITPQIEFPFFHRTHVSCLLVFFSLFCY